MYTVIQPMYLVLLCCCCRRRCCMSTFIASDRCGNRGRAALGRFGPGSRRAVGTWAWVQTRGNRRSPTARTRARRGTSESVWLSHCFCMSTQKNDYFLPWGSIDLVIVWVAEIDLLFVCEADIITWFYREHWNWPGFCVGARFLALFECGGRNLNWSQCRD